MLQTHRFLELNSLYWIFILHKQVDGVHRVSVTNRDIGI